MRDIMEGMYRTLMKTEILVRLIIIMVIFFACSLIFFSGHRCISLFIAGATTYFGARWVKTEEGENKNG